MHHRGPSARIAWGSPAVWGFFGINFVGFAGLGWALSGGLDVTAEIWWMALWLYLGRMFFITAGYHRYFSHQSYRFRGEDRWFGRTGQFLLALGGALAAQKGPIWWSENHVYHHQHADQPEDLHSPKQDGFWWAHCQWFLSGQYDIAPIRVERFRKYPELMLLERCNVVPVILLAGTCLWRGGLPGLLICFFLSTAVLGHCTSFINSLAHTWGTRPHQTPDTSRNNFLLAIITLGEGWHCNHHKSPKATVQGWRWWQVDITFYLLSLLQLIRVIHRFNPKPNI